MCLFCHILNLHFDPNSSNTFIAGYIDPGTGVIFGTAITSIIGYIIAGLGSSLFFIKKIFKPRTKLFFGIIILVIIGATLFYMNQKKPSNITSKVVILGFDGLDPKVVDEGIKRGMLPNLASLKKNGGYQYLGTTTPPQSPVAWASFITGANPNNHHVYDFITRDPYTYEPSLVFSKEKYTIEIPKFWEVLSQNKISTNVLFLPDTYPAAEIDGKMISGMGTPDITGTEGTFTLFTTKKYDVNDMWRGNIVGINKTQKVETSITGPKYKGLTDIKKTNIPLEIESVGEDKVKLTFQDNIVELKKGQWSDWLRVEFSIDFFTKIKGIARFYVKSVSPDLEIYLSPINIDPNKPIFQISYPRNFASNIAKEQGLFSTLGLPHDTWALEEDVLDEKAFLTQIDSVIEEREKIYFNALDKTEGGVFMGYFGMTDTVQHMFWRFRTQPKSPYRDTILNYYKKMDDLLGKTLNKINKEDVLIVVSDHGFGEFDYEFNVNTWLKKEGYLSLKDGFTEGGELLQNINWSKTKAYAVGYNSIYLNMIGREGEGILTEDQALQINKEIKQKLLSLKNPSSRSKVVKHVYDKQDLDNTDPNSPDLIVGYYMGTRSSWDTAVGATPKDIFKKRVSKWSGDHLIDATEVPGVVFSNRKINKTNPNIIDIIPSVLRMLNVELPPTMQGTNIF